MHGVETIDSSLCIIHSITYINHNYYPPSLQLLPTSYKLPRQSYSSFARKKRKHEKRNHNPKYRPPAPEVLEMLQEAQERVAPYFLQQLQDQPEHRSLGFYHPTSNPRTHSSMQIYSNPSTQPLLHPVWNCIFPKQSQLLQANVFHLTPEHFKHQQYQLVLLDPPYPNKSVQRKQHYQTFENISDLTKLHFIKAILHPDNAIVGIWVTNNPLYDDFIRHTLFQEWELEYVDTWYWLKVAGNGEFVTPLHSSHRLPYEKLILGVRGSTYHSKFRCLQSKVFASVPLRHSWKPPIEHLFTSILKENAAKLEIFARELRPGFLSVGNQVTKFQQLEYFHCPLENDKDDN